MKTRKPKTPVSKRARPAAAQRGTARSRVAAPRKATARGKPASRRKAAPGAPAESRTHADGAWVLTPECTVAEAESLKAELARRLAVAEPVIVDVSVLQRIDTAGLQLLAAFVRDRRTAGRSVQWRGRASALDAAAGLLGLNDMLELAGEVGR
jgi:phospholipid transport system transporter-binding protein